MGYTHYWERAKILPKRMWQRYIEDLKKAYSLLPEHSHSSGAFYMNEPLKICDGYGEKEEPEFNDNYVNFNGCGELSHENFLLYRDMRDFFEDLKYEANSDWIKTIEAEEKSKKELYNFLQFCKTARLPYDLFVQIALLLAYSNFNRDGKVRFKFSSDGNEDDWQEAIRFVADNFPEHQGMLMKMQLNEECIYE